MIRAFSQKRAVLSLAFVALLFLSVLLGLGSVSAEAEEGEQTAQPDASQTDSSDPSEGSESEAIDKQKTETTAEEESENISPDDPNAVNPQQLPDSSFIYDTSILDLSTADAYFDEQTVQIIGEVVGDNIKADESDNFRWITLVSQDSNSNANIIVYMSKSDADKIDSFGKYEVTGTTLQVRGTYHLVCSEHDGLSDIHAEYVSVVARGEEHHKAFEFKDFIPGALVVVVGLGMLAVYHWMRERRR